MRFSHDCPCCAVNDAYIPTTTTDGPRWDQTRRYTKAENPSEGQAPSLPYIFKPNHVWTYIRSSFIRTIHRSILGTIRRHMHVRLLWLSLIAGGRGHITDTSHDSGMCTAIWIARHGTAVALQDQLASIQETPCGSRLSEGFLALNVLVGCHDCIAGAPPPRP
jgi:hypothetical protein